MWYKYSVVLQAIAQSEDEGRDYAETADVAEAAFDSRSRQARRRVTKGGRLDEVVYHIDIKVRREIRHRRLRNKGFNTGDTWAFRHQTS